MRNLILIFCLSASALSHWDSPALAAPQQEGSAVAVDQPQQYDVVIYGGTSAGVIAAVQAKRMGLSAVIAGPDVHLGGLSSGGLGWTDSGNKEVIGGVAREFYHRIWQHYQDPGAWRWESKDAYGNQGQGTPAMDGERRTMWIFEPHVAESVFEDFVAEYDIPVHRDVWLDRNSGVTKVDQRITKIRMLNGLTLSGKMFIDATYEGDLMAAAGVSYHVGRESREQYGEEWNGVQTGVLHHGHHFGVLPEPLSPYVIPGDPSSGLLPRISPDPPGEFGSADERIQAYCYRMCMTDDDRNRVPFPKPEGYDPGQYELLLRVLEAGWREGFRKFDPIPNHKTDTNNHGPFSTDNIGYNYDYPEGSYERRREILAEHVLYQQGLMYFLANDSRVPQDVRTKFSQWGLAADEFVDNDNWPHQIYVREARRLVGQFVMTENELLKKRPTPQSIGMGSYTMDSHNVQRYVTPEGHVQNEGDIGVSTRGPYEIAWGAILPKPEQCENLLVPVCLSSSHIAFGSIRMEPVFMILGQSAATTAALAIEGDQAVQAIDYEKLRQRLIADGQVLTYAGASLGLNRLDPTKLPGIVIDDSAAKLSGHWTASTSGASVGREYFHDGNARDGRASAKFEATLPSGRYEVRVSYAAHANRATNVPVTVRHSAGEVTLTMNQRREAPHEKLLFSLGEFEFTDAAPAVVELNNRETDGYVIVDAVQFLPVK
ncbi:MAG: FAD-dependent oxidoreductase [Pirellulaceae bacterium]